MNLLYSDAALDFERDANLIERYSAALQRATYRALNEEAILITTFRVRHTT